MLLFILSDPVDNVGDEAEVPGDRVREHLDRVRDRRHKFGNVDTLQRLD